MPFLRIVKLLIVNNIQCPERNIDKMKLRNGRYKILFEITSKECREALKGEDKYLNSKLVDGLCDRTKQEYFNQVKRLSNTKHKNTLLRLWNGDCLSYTRLVHMGLVGTNRCPNCETLDTPEHVLTECDIASQVWQRVLQVMPQKRGTNMIMYVLGINDTKNELMIKAELIKYLMHFRDLNAEQIIQRALSYIKCTNKYNLALCDVIDAILSN
jgi:zinc-binding in reverse transcriptase